MRAELTSNCRVIANCFRFRYLAKQNKQKRREAGEDEEDGDGPSNEYRDRAKERREQPEDEVPEYVFFVVVVCRSLSVHTLSNAARSL